MELKPSALPLHQDARLKVRSRIFLEGNFFVDLQPGTPASPELGDDDVIPAGAHLEDGYRAALEFFRAQDGADRPTAVTCFNDLVAMGACRALAELGLRVPEDVSVVGYDDIPLLEYLPVPLTSVRVPTLEMGRLAAELLLGHVEGGSAVPTQKIYLEAELVVRASTAAPARR